MGAELSASSTTCCTPVLQLPSRKEGLCRREALLHPLLHRRTPPTARCHSVPPPSQSLQSAARSAWPRGAAAERCEVAGR